MFLKSINKCLERGPGGKRFYFTLLKEINWILLLPIHNILRSIGLRVSYVMVKFGGVENLFDVLMKDTNYCDDGFIADTSNFDTVGIAFANATE